MSFLSALAQLEPVLISAANSPLGKQISQYGSQIIFALLTGSGTVRLGDYQVTISNNGAPVHFTIALLVVAIENIVQGKTADVQIGSVKLEFSKLSAVGTVPPAAAA